MYINRSPGNCVAHIIRTAYTYHISIYHTGMSGWANYSAGSAWHLLEPVGIPSTLSGLSNNLALPWWGALCSPKEKTNINWKTGKKTETCENLKNNKNKKLEQSKLNRSRSLTTTAHHITTTPLRAGRRSTKGAKFQASLARAQRWEHLNWRLVSRLTLLAGGLGNPHAVGGNRTGGKRTEGERVGLGGLL